MRKLKSVAGWSWAVLCIILVLWGFMGWEKIARALVRATGLSVSPVYSGGEIVLAEDRAGYKTFIHRPVFDGLLKKRRTGFIQVDFVQTTSFPLEIRQSVSYDEDGPRSFGIILTTNPLHAGIVSAGPQVHDVNRLAAEGGKIMLRVRLTR